MQELKRRCEALTNLARQTHESSLHTREEYDKQRVREQRYLARVNRLRVHMADILRSPLHDLVDACGKIH